MIFLDNGTTSQILIHEFHNYVSGLYPLAFVESLFTCYLGTFLGDTQVHSWPCTLADPAGFLGELRILLNVVKVGVLPRFPLGLVHLTLSCCEWWLLMTHSCPLLQRTALSQSHLDLEAMSSPDLSQWLTNMEYKGKWLLSKKEQLALWCSLCSEASPWGQAEADLLQRPHTFLVFLLWPVLLLSLSFWADSENKTLEKKKIPILVCF